MKRKKRLTNVQLVKKFMEHSKHGALAQMFVMDALHKLVKAVAKSKPEDYGEHSVVNPEAWINCAKELQAILEERED